jgi:hypothetical protein
MKRVHQLKTGDLIRHYGAVFRVIEDARPSYGFSLWHRENGKCKPLAGPVDTAEARAEWVRNAFLFILGTIGFYGSLWLLLVLGSLLGA